MTATLAHHDTQLRTRAQLALIPAPQPQGRYHTPVPHVELVNLLEACVQETLKATVASEQFSVSANDTKMFGVMNLNPTGKHVDVAEAIGFRHANDRSMSLQFVAGQHVFVCDNMVLRGDTIFLREKHDVRTLNLRAQLTAGLERFAEQYKALEQETSILKDTPLTDQAAKAFLIDSFIKDHVMPLHLLPQVAQAYFEPPHAEFAPRNAWSLHNAFTEVAKGMPMIPRMAATQALGRLMGLATA